MVFYGLFYANSQRKVHHISTKILPHHFCLHIGYFRLYFIAKINAATAITKQIK